MNFVREWKTGATIVLLPLVIAYALLYLRHWLISS